MIERNMFTSKAFCSLRSHNFIPAGTQKGFLVKSSDGVKCKCAIIVSFTLFNSSDMNDVTPSNGGSGGKAASNDNKIEWVERSFHGIVWKWHWNYWFFEEKMVFKNENCWLHKLMDGRERGKGSSIYVFLFKLKNDIKMMGCRGGSEVYENLRLWVTSFMD